MALAIEQIMAMPPLAFRSVTSKDGLGVYASSDMLFKRAVFGRDSLDVTPHFLRTLDYCLTTKRR